MEQEHAAWKAWKMSSEWKTWEKSYEQKCENEKNSEKLKIDFAEREVFPFVIWKAFENQTNTNKKNKAIKKKRGK